MLLFRFPVDRDTHESFCRLQSNVFFFKPIKWYIKMHHVCHCRTVSGMAASLKINDNISLTMEHVDLRDAGNK